MYDETVGSVRKGLSKVTSYNGKFGPKMLRIARICVLGVFTISFFCQEQGTSAR